jgi:hypothetical protein
MNTIALQKTLITFALILAVSFIGFSSAYGYGSSATKVGVHAQRMAALQSSGVNPNQSSFSFATGQSTTTNAATLQLIAPMGVGISGMFTQVEKSTLTAAEKNAFYTQFNLLVTGLRSLLETI